MSDCSPEYDLYECIEAEDIPLWFAATQIGNAHTARQVVEHFLKYGIVSLLRKNMPTQDWEWRVILEDPNNWIQNHSSAQLFTLVSTGNEQLAKSFFGDPHSN